MKGLKFSINVSADVGAHLCEASFTERLSESSIVEVALMQLFARVRREELGSFLRKHGASLRRSSDRKQKTD